MSVKYFRLGRGIMSKSPGAQYDSIIEILSRNYPDKAPDLQNLIPRDLIIGRTHYSFLPRFYRELEDMGSISPTNTTAHAIWFCKGDPCCEECLALHGEVFTIENIPDRPCSNCSCTLRYYGDASAKVSHNFKKPLQSKREHGIMYSTTENVAHETSTNKSDINSLFAEIENAVNSNALHTHQLTEWTINTAVQNVANLALSDSFSTNPELVNQRIDFLVDSMVERLLNLYDESQNKGYNHSMLATQTGGGIDG